MRSDFSLKAKDTMSLDNRSIFYIGSRIGWVSALIFKEKSERIEHPQSEGENVGKCIPLYNHQASYRLTQGGRQGFAF